MCNMRMPRSPSDSRGTGMKSLIALVLSLLIAASPLAQTGVKPPKETTLERFLRYAKIDTQSKDDQQTVPSTRKQFNLAKRRKRSRAVSFGGLTPVCANAEAAINNA